MGGSFRNSFSEMHLLSAERERGEGEVRERASSKTLSAIHFLRKSNCTKITMREKEQEREKKKEKERWRTRASGVQYISSVNIMNGGVVYL